MRRRARNTGVPSAVLVPDLRVPVVSCACTLQKESTANVALPIVSLCVVPPTESRRIHLVAIAQSGVRFYFTTIKDR